MSFAAAPVFLVLLLGLGGSGHVPHDLASFIELNDYFTRGSIEAKADNLLRVAARPPTDVKESFVQLLVIRWLGENTDQLGEQKDAVRKALQQLAQGPEGFARDYAQIALARVEGKPLTHRTFARDNLRKDAFAWFPEQVQIAGAFDFRAAPGQKTGAAHEQALGKQIKDIQAHFQKLIPNPAKDEMYIFAETVGNVRIDRLSFGIIYDAENRGNEQIFARGTGRFDHKRLVDYLRQTLPNLKFDEKKGPRGEPITFITFEQPPTFVLIGDTEVLIAGHGVRKEGNSELAELALAVRDGKKPSMLKGPLGKLLEEAAPEASGLILGEIPAIARAELARTPVGVTPHQFTLECARDGTGEGFALRFRGHMDNEADAKRLAGSFKDLVKTGLDEIKNQPQRPEIELAKLVLETIQEVDLKTEATKVIGELRIAPETQKNLLEKTGEAVKKATDG